MPFDPEADQPRQDGAGPPNELHGRVVTGDDPAVMTEAIEHAFRYRGDVTIERRSGAAVDGYLYDRTRTRDPGKCVLRMIPSDGGPRVVVPLCDVTALTFTGRDTAAGRSFDAWIQKYVERKLAGEVANIESDPLDDDDPSI